MKATVRYCGVSLSCEFEFYPAEKATRTEPGNPAYAALETCKVAGVDVMEMLTREQQDEIETLCAEAVAEQAEIDAGEHADLRRTEKAMEGFL